MENTKAKTKILVPGMFSPGTVFKELEDEIKKQGFFCFSLTFPFQDKNDKKNFEHDSLAKVKFMDKINFAKEKILEIEREYGEYDLVGHSAGGLMVLKLASLPEIKPKKIVLLAPAAPFLMIPIYFSVFKSFFLVIITPKFWKKKIRMSFDEVEYSMLNQVEEKNRGEIYNQLVQESGRFIFEVGLWFANFKGIFKGMPTRVRYSKIKCPVTIMIGTKDRITPKVIAKNIRDRLNVRIFIKNLKIALEKDQKKFHETVRYMELPEKGHWLQKEALSLILGEILRENP